MKRAILFIFIIPICLYGQTKEYYQNKIDSVKKIRDYYQQLVEQRNKELELLEKSMNQLIFEDASNNGCSTRTRVRRVGLVPPK